jgi:uncharacterized OB-fold protein
MARQVPVAEGLFRIEADGPRLLGGRDRATGEIVFPAPVGPLAARFEEAALGREGTLWSFTVQRFPPKQPFIGDAKNFRPYAVGYVELPGEIIVETRIKTDNLAALKIGMPMRITTDSFATNADGDAVVTYAFEPAC